jgi:phosphodiesterase/alkaline phosphatase D-like protein
MSPPALPGPCGVVGCTAGLTFVTCCSFFIRQPGFDPGTPVFADVRVKGNATWARSAASATPAAATDWTAFVHVNNLAANSTYEWKFSLDSAVAGTFTTPVAVGTPSSFRFSWGSCVLTNFPAFSGDNPGTGNIIDQAPVFLAFIGDWIYADVPYQRPLSASSSLYRQNFRDGGVLRMLQTIPSFFTHVLSLVLHGAHDD